MLRGVHTQGQEPYNHQSPIHANTRSSIHQFKTHTLHAPFLILSPTHNSIPPHLLNIILTNILILGREKPRRILPQPIRQLDHLIAKFPDGLLVHVGLGDEFREGDFLHGVSE